MTTALAQPALLLREPGAGKLLNQLPQPTTRQTSTDPMRQHPTRPPQPHEQQSFRKSNLLAVATARDADVVAGICVRRELP
ncbi:hypothetical protein ACFC4M_37605, partial [Streptomyces sp. NPDC056019]|uniref:hypothetical protein n=1 Tax=Streptomyces sp. NPDC056019 TaxID=3345681 RepID=UPI0035D85620